MLDGGPSCAVLRLIARPHLERGGFHLDRFDAYLDDELITTSRQPLLDGARALLARGFDPDALLTMRHAGRDYDSFRPQAIGELAKWTITERDRKGLRRERWRSPKRTPSSTRDGVATGRGRLAEGKDASPGPTPFSVAARGSEDGMVADGAARIGAAPVEEAVVR